MSRLASILRKVKLDYREFQAANQSIPEPWKESSKRKSISSLLTVSGLSHLRISFGHAYKLWKLQLTDREKASKVIENFGKHADKDSNSVSEVDEELSKIADNIRNISKDDVSKKTNEMSENFKKNARDSAQIFKDNKESMKEFTYDRLKIMSDALRAFNQGYQEGKNIGEREALEKSPEELYDEVVSKPVQDKIGKVMENIKKNTNN